MEKALAARVARHDREIAAIRKLILTGMKMLAQTQKVQKDTDQYLNRLAGEQVAMREEMRKLAAAQRETDRELKSLIRALQRGGNGRGPSPH